MGQGACSLYKPPTMDDVPIVKKIPPRAEPRSRYGNPLSYVVFGKRYHTLTSSYDFVERGIASWYGKKFHGRRTSSGEEYDMYAMTAAHTRLPLPTYVQVTNLKNGKKIIVRVNDRGPFHNNRIIDLSYTAASKLGIVRQGTGLVEVRALNERNYLASARKGGKVTGTSTKKVASLNPKIFVQVGAFSTRDNANRMRRRVDGQNLGTVTVSSVIKGRKKLHRVRIGPLPTVQSADEVIAELYNMGMEEHHVVIE